MTALAELQRRFKSQVLHRDVDMGQAIIGNAQADSTTRINIYVDGYRLRLIEVLGNDYQGLRTLVGPERFEQLCGAYVEAHPSRHYNARWYGDDMTAFLTAHAPWSQEPSLAEMAALDWDLTLVFDVADEPLARFEHILALSPEQWPGMMLRLHGGVRHRSLRWNVAAIRVAGDSGGQIPPPQVLDHEHEIAVWRRDLNVRYRLLEVDEAGVIVALETGLSFGDLCAALCEWHAEETVAQRAAQLLKTWVDEQWLRTLNSESAPVPPAESGA